MLARFVVLDLETTGLSPEEHRIVEVSAILVEGGQVTDRLCTLVNPGTPIPPEATAIHGLRDRDVARSPSEREAVERILLFLADPALLLVAHNARFDVSFLARALWRSGLELPRNPVLDSLALARRVLPLEPSRSLDALAQLYGIPVRLRHRALADCEVLARLLPLLVRDEPQGPSGVARLLRSFPAMAVPRGPQTFRSRVPALQGRALEARSPVA